MTTFRYLERRSADLHVVAEWSSASAEVYPVGPRRLVIELSRPVPEGITSDTLRQVGRHLDDMVGEFNEVLAVGGHRTMVRRYTEDRLASLPPDGDAFHRGLLDIHEDLDRRGEASPTRVMAEAMRIPEETMRACLRIARRHAHSQGSA
ncbi:hypothetical protein AB0C07_28705 [Actinoplanes missouriensis]|uniref:hypothetical protein n=1 Tax=Actinoplanes missouriensis TaxID=1866 RepID=UPI0033EC857F